MADVANTAPVGEDNPHARMASDAYDVQRHAARAIYLARAINSAASELTGDQAKNTRLETVDAIMVLAEMIEDAANTAKAIGERMEAHSVQGRA